MCAMEDTLQTLVETLEKYNAAYRSGKPLVSDSEYDRLVERLREVDPDHPFLDVLHEIFQMDPLVRKAQDVLPSAGSVPLSSDAMNHVGRQRVLLD